MAPPQLLFALCLLVFSWCYHVHNPGSAREGGPRSINGESARALGKNRAKTGPYFQALAAWTFHSSRATFDPVDSLEVKRERRAQRAACGKRRPIGRPVSVH